MGEDVFRELVPGRLGRITLVLAREPRAVAEYRQALLAAVEVGHLTIAGGRSPHHEAA